MLYKIRNIHFAILFKSMLLANVFCIKAAGQEITLNLVPVQKGLQASSTSFQKASVNVDPLAFLIFKDGSISNNYVQCNYKTYKGHKIKMAIAIIDSVFKIVADENGNGNLADDSFFVINSSFQFKDSFPEFNFNDTLGMPVNKFAIMPVNNSFEPVYSATGFPIDNLKFSFISYDCLETDAFKMGNHNYKIYLKKSVVLWNEEHEKITQGYHTYFIGKQNEDGKYKGLEFGTVLNLMDGQFSKSYENEALTINSLHFNKHQIIILKEKGNKNRNVVDLNKLKAISLISGNKESIFFDEKPALFVFSGSWCKGCYEIKPALDKYLLENAKNYNVFYLLKEKSLDDARRFARKSGYRSNVYFESLGEEANIDLTSVLKAGSYPSVVIVNKNGELLFNESGSNLMDKLILIK